MRLRDELLKARGNAWICRGDALPEKSYDHPVIVQFNDGYIALSDGRTVHDDISISLWKELSEEENDA